MTDEPTLKKDKSVTFSEDNECDHPEDPLTFPETVTFQVWEDADEIKGRDGDRWRYDCLGNPVLKGATLADAPNVAYVFDGKIAKCKGGSDDLDNCILLAASVSASKGDMPFERVKRRYPPS